MKPQQVDGRQVKPCVYVDRLNISSVGLILLHSQKARVFVIDERTLLHNLYKCFLKCLSVNVRQLEFSLSSLRDENDQSLYVTALQEASRISVILNDIFPQLMPGISQMDEHLQKRFVHLFLLKSTQEQISAFILYHLIFKRLNSNAKDKLIAARPPFWPDVEVLREYSGPEVLFYKNRMQLIIVLRRWMRPFKTYLTAMVMAVFGRTKRKMASNGNSLLMFAEAGETSDNSYRIQPFWANVEKKSQIPVVILETPMSKKLFPVNQNVDSNLNLKYSKIENFLTSRNGTDPESKNDKLAVFRKLIATEIRKTLPIFLIFELAKLWVLAFLAEQFASACKGERIRLIFLSELHTSYADLAMLSGIAADIPVVSCQYSSLWRVSPSMLSVADAHFIFSDMYREVYATSQVYPKEFHVIGYPLQPPVSALRDRCLARRAEVEAQGSKFIVSYLDENFFDDQKWSLITKNDHLKDLRDLSTFALGNQDVAIVLKPQFNHNAINRQKHSESSITEAILKHKLVELKSGSGMRNCVLPTEVGLISDICICLKIGITAAIEVALLGKRVILINNHNVRGKWDFLFEGQKIVYPDLKSALRDIKKFKENPFGDDIGNWENIISNFVSTGDKYAANRIEEYLKNIGKFND